MKLAVQILMVLFACTVGYGEQQAPPSVVLPIESPETDNTLRIMFFYDLEEGETWLMIDNTWNNIAIKEAYAHYTGRTAYFYDINAEKNQHYVDMYKITISPTTLIVNTKDGSVVKGWVGMLDALAMYRYLTEEGDDFLPKYSSKTQPQLGKYKLPKTRR